VSLLRPIAALVFIVAIPIFLVLTNVRVAATEQRVYEYSFSRYDAEAVTGIERAELDRAASEIIGYFRDSEADALDIRVADGGEMVPLFNQREVLHMRDVRSLMRATFRLHELAFVYLVGYVAAVFLWSAERPMRRLAQQAMIGGGATVAILAAAAIGVLIGFDDLFTQFHLLSFSNDFWRLSSARDHLIQMFPQGFWFDVTLAVGVITIGQGLAILGAGWAYVRWRDERGEPAPVGGVLS
jgi:integral membrane protein (TIGR01906 family)